MQTEKLTLAQLSGYLAYGLMCQYEGTINGKELSEQEKKFSEDGHSFDFTVQPITGLKVAPIKEVRLYKNYWKVYIGNHPRHAKSFVNGHDFKPLVIPLDRLTEAQWIEVFKAGSQEFSDAFTVDVSVDWVTLDCCYDISTFHFRWKEFRISHRMPPFNQLAAFNKLHELHADLHGLIEKGLALNKLDYEK